MKKFRQLTLVMMTLMGSITISSNASLTIANESYSHSGAIAISSNDTKFGPVPNGRCGIVIVEACPANTPAKQCLIRLYEAPWGIPDCLTGSHTVEIDVDGSLVSYTNIDMSSSCNTLITFYDPKHGNLPFRVKQTGECSNR